MRVLTAHCSILTTRNVTLKHVPSAAPAPPQQLPPIAGEGESIAEEGASGEGASSQGGGSVEDLYSESNLDMTEVWRPVPPATREAPAAEPGAGAEEVQKAPPQHHRSPPGGPISVVSTAAVEAAAATTAASAVTVARQRGSFRACGETCAFWRAPRTAKQTHEVPAAGLHERVLRGYPADVCHKDRGSQEGRVGGGRGNRKSLRFTA